MNGLFDCRRSRVPVLGTAAHIPSCEIGSGYFQETHPQVLFQGMQSLLRTARKRNQMPRPLEFAIRDKRGVR
jgi:pyruvate dehydrogenase (quinone)